MANVTSERCAALRADCPGSRSIPLAVVVTVALALLGMIAGSHLLLAADLATTSRNAAAGAAASEVRADQLAANTRKLDDAIGILRRLEALIDERGREKTP